MRKLYIALAAFAALTLSQIGHAIPTIPGATDIATADGQTYYALMGRADGWYVEGYSASGAANGFSVQLTPSHNVNPTNQHYVGLAFNGDSFYTLRNDLTSKKGEDSWSVLGFNLNGSFDGNRTVLGPYPVRPSRQMFVGLSIADEGFFALRDDLVSAKNQDSWSLIGFDSQGAWNGISQIVDSGVPSTTPFTVVASFNQSPAKHEYSTNSVPEPGTGLLLGSLLGLGLLGRKKLKAA